jgi:hypothetical protein
VPANDASKMLSAGRRRPERPSLAAVAPEPAPKESTRRPVALSYVKASCFLTPDQRTWLNEVVARIKLDGLDGISASDVVRLGLARLHEEVGDGFDLTAALVDQAHAEAERFPGRKNRGLPIRR